MCENKEKNLVFSSFIIKLVALITMTMDHVGYYLTASGFKDGPIYITAMILRAFGKIALPLFCFGVAEGVKHTKNFWKYFLKLSLMFSVMLLSYIIVDNVAVFKENGISFPRMGIIFLDLMLGALGAYCLKNKNNWIKALAILPLAFGIMSYAVSVYEFQTNVLVYWLPYYLRTQGGWKSVFMILAFYLVDTFVELYYKKQQEYSGIDPEAIKGTYQDKLTKNLFSVLIIIFAAIVNAAIGLITPIHDGSLMNTLSILAAVFVLFYNGKRGYNKKWFTHGCYLYYPVHFILIFVVFELIFML